MSETLTRDAKLLQYLNEAYGKERELETTLQAHITMATRATYKKRLQQHHKETRAHARQVERRIKQLGGRAHAGPVPEVVTEAAGAVETVIGKGTAAAQGALHGLRGTSEEEKQLKNAKDEFKDEAEEIANYRAIESLAESVGDGETAKLARGIRRDEERMQNFLDRLIPQLTRALARAEVPASERAPARRRRAKR
jgi:ferritin-like metal-binding protein YciE